MSNICYTVVQKIKQDLTWGFPSKRSHGKEVIVSLVIAFELCGKIIEGIKVVCSVETLIILAVTARYLAIVPGGIGFDELVLNTVLI